MRLVHIQGAERPHLGVKVEQGIIDVAAAAAALGVKHVPTLLVNPETELEALRVFVTRATAEVGGKDHPSWLLDESKVRFAPVMVHPEKIICVGLNYRQHAAETGAQVPKVPILFSKFNNALAAHQEVIPLPSNGEQHDYEAELAVVIGRTARHVTVEKALDYVFGYCTANDVSCRDWQLRTAQWLLGKTPDKFFPIGPYLVTADEAGDPQNMTVRCWVNGELRQDSNTADMIFSVAECISYISQHFTLKPGDIISTGTPQGVALGMKDPLWLKDGDEVTVEVGNLGKLVNVMAKE